MAGRGGGALAKSERMSAFVSRLGAGAGGGEEAALGADVG